MYVNIPSRDGMCDEVEKQRNYVITHPPENEQISIEKKQFFDRKWIIFQPTMNFQGDMLVFKGGQIWWLDTWIDKFLDPRDWYILLHEWLILSVN